MADYNLSYSGQQIDQAVGLVINPSQNVNVIPNTSTGVSNFGYTCKYYPMLGMVFFRCGFNFQDPTAGDPYLVANVLSTLPSKAHPLSVYCSTGAVARLETNGDVSVRFDNDKTGLYTIFVAGFWFV